jgi:hypothetical protein
MPTPAQLQTMLSEDGLDQTLRTLALNNLLNLDLLADPAWSQPLCDHLFDGAYARAREPMNKFLHDIAIRPHWSLNSILSRAAGEGESLIHLFPRGHELADSSDILDGIVDDPRLKAACGFQGATVVLFNRGNWQKTLASTNPAECKICPHCLPFASDYPETEDAEAENPLPTPELALAFADWRKRERGPALEVLCSEANTKIAEDLITPALYEHVLAFAARKLNRYPRPNVVRALRSNGVKTVAWTEFDDEVLNLHRSEAEWMQTLRPLLDHHLQNTSSKKIPVLWAHTLKDLLIAESLRQGLRLTFVTDAAA